MKTKILIFFIATCCFGISMAQEIRLIHNNKIVRSYLVYGDFHFIKTNDIFGDTLKSIAINGEIQNIYDNAVDLTNMDYHTNYIFENKMVEKYEQSSDWVSEKEILLENIAYIYVSPRIKKIGNVLQVIGVMALIYAPFGSFRYKAMFDENSDWKDNPIKAKRYVYATGLGLGLLTIGFTIKIPFKQKLYKVRDASICNECYSKYRIYEDAKIEIINEN